MFTLSNFIDNDDIRTLAQLGPFRVIEYPVSYTHLTLPTN